MTSTILSGTGSWLVVGLFDLLLLIVLELGWDVLRETPQLFGGRSKALFLASVGAVGLAAMITLPFLLRDVGDFVRSIVELHLQQPFREDSLSLLAVGVRVMDWPPASMHTILMGLALFGTSTFVLWKAPRTTWAVAAGCAFVMLGFVILSKQAFANYDFLIAGLILLSLSSWDARSAPQEVGDEDDRRSRSELRSARAS